MSLQQVVTFDELTSPDHLVHDAAWTRLLEYAVPRVRRKMIRSHGSTCHGVDIADCVEESAQIATHAMLEMVLAGKVIQSPEGLFINIVENKVNGQVDQAESRGRHLDEHYPPIAKDTKQIRNVSSQVHLQEQDPEVRRVIQRGLKSFYLDVLDRVKEARPSSDVKSPLLQVLAIELYCQGHKAGVMLDLVNTTRPTNQQIKSPQISRVRDESVRLIHECMVRRGIMKVARGQFASSQIPDVLSHSMRDYFGKDSPGVDYWLRRQIGCPALSSYSRCMHETHQADFELLRTTHRDLIECEYCIDNDETIAPDVLKSMLNQVHASRASLYRP